LKKVLKLSDKKYEKAVASKYKKVNDLHQVTIEEAVIDRTTIYL